MPAYQQYPHVRALKVCLSCGGEKSTGLLVCWECHNMLSMLYNSGYGPVMEGRLQYADDMAISRQCDEPRHIED